MSKFKTNIYIDRKLWEKFKEYARRRGIKVSHLIEGLIKEVLVDDLLDDLICEERDAEPDFEPVIPRNDPVSDLVRKMRNERGDLLSGH